MISAPFGGKGPRPEIYRGPVQSKEVSAPVFVIFLYVAQVFPQPAETTTIVMNRNKIEPAKKPIWRILAINLKMELNFNIVIDLPLK